ncbi:MAG: response regulator [Bryobacteraceae bacterium]|jgi:DNA-binding response OmpR family regulator
MPDKLDVLLIEDQADAAALVQRALARSESPSIRVEAVDTLEKGLAKLEAATFDAILLDLNLPDSNGLATFNKVREHQGPGALIVLTSVEDDELALGAVREGADEYLVKGEGDEPALARRVRYAVERSRRRAREAPLARPDAKILGFVGVKGGAGTTTVALNIAAVLARQGRSVIAVELKPDLGLFSFQLKHTPAANLSSLWSMAPGRIDAVEVGKRLCTFPHGLRVLFGPQKPDEFREVDPLAAAAVIRAASQLAECTLIDLPSLAFPMSQAAIRQCTFVSMVLERDAMSAYAAKLFLPVLHSWGISEQITGAIVVSRTLAYTPTPIPEIAAQLSCSITGVIPPAVELCAKASLAGSPIVFLEPECTFSNTMTELALRLAADTVKPMVR